MEQKSRITIVIGPEKNEDLTVALMARRSFFFSEKESDAFLYHLKHTEVDSYIIEGNGKKVEQLKQDVECIHFLNALVTVIILVKDQQPYVSLKGIPGTALVENKQEIFDFLKDLPENQRRSNRIVWPVAVVFWKSKERPKFTGKILSLSASGCFIQTDETFELQQELNINIRFKEFNLRTEGVVVRVSQSGNRNHKGVAVQFIDVTTHTEHLMEEIINEKILNEIMNRFSEDSNLEAF